MLDESKAKEPQPTPRQILVDALVKNIFSNAEMKDEEKADACYKMILAAMSKFIPQSQLEARLLNEARALEQGLGPAVKDFDVVIWAKPKSNVKKGSANEPTQTSIESPAEPVAGSESPSDSGTGTSAS